jgi:hypothetical protein
LKRRLSTDFGFDVALKYEDRDGDLITLSSQDDLIDLLQDATNETINVIVSESTALPQLNLKAGTTKPPALFGGTRDTSARSSGLNSSSQMMAFPKLNSLSKVERFPIISESNKVSTDNMPLIRWKRAEMLGQGAFGVVYLGLNIDTGELMAVKQMATEEVSKRELSSLDNEINLLKNLRHPNIVRYIGTEITSAHMSIFLEYVPGGSLKALIDKFGQLEESVVRSYTRQLLVGLEYLHRNGFAHRDIKGANCLVGNDGVIKLADFGNSKHWRPTPPAAANGATAATATTAAAGNVNTQTGDIKGNET